MRVVRFHGRAGVGEFSDLESSGWTPDSPDVVWVDLEKPHDDELGVLRDPFDFHPLAVEDCLTPEHQPKVEEFGSHLFIIARGIDFNPPIEGFQTLKLAAFLGTNYLVTYHRRPMRSVTAIHDRLLADGESSKLRERTPGQILVQLLDQLLDHYVPVLDSVEQELDELEEAIFEPDPDARALDRLMGARRRAVEVRRTIAPHRDVFARVSRGEFPVVDPAAVAFWRDLYDSAYRLTEEADTTRDLLGGTLEAHLSMVSHRLNEVMKVLTIFATIILPLTFIAGIYGMNFAHMPELEWTYGYPAVLAVMLTIAGGLLWFFRRKGWL